MRAGALAAMGLILASQAAGTPPSAGGIMIHSDSSLALYWVHPDVNHYEQGYDSYSENGWLVGGVDPGAYAAAVNFAAPYASYIESISIRISLIDQFDYLPGDQFSPFRIGVYKGGPDREPAGEPLFSGSGRLCGGEPCADEWFRQPLHTPLLTSVRIWQIFRWDDSTPCAPQLRAHVKHASDPTAMMGFDDGGGFVWTNLNTLPVFRQRLLGIIPLDTAVSEGWRHRLPAENRPDSFLISGFLGGFVAQEFSLPNRDTLMFRMTGAHFDSLAVRSCYGDATDDSVFTVIMEDAKWPTFSADMVFPDSKGDPSTASLHIVNLGPETIDLQLGYDTGSIVFEVDSVGLAGYESKMIPGVVTEPPGDTADLIVILADKEARFYPLIVTSIYPQTGQTDADEATDEGMPTIRNLVQVYPNPCFKSVNIVAENALALKNVSIYNVIGERIADLPLSGTHMTWNGCDRDGRSVSPGIYFVRIRYEDATLTRAILMMR